MGVDLDADTDRVGRRAWAQDAAKPMKAHFDAFVASVREQVGGHLTTWLEDRVVEARARGRDVGIVADGIRQLTSRGGKRMRPVLLAASYVACDGARGVEAVIPVSVGLELFQTYLLAHDDLMDGDAVRRGGPSLPALMRDHFPERQAAAMAILAGDMAAAWSQRALLEGDLPPQRVLRASRELAKVHEAVVAGQVLDMALGATDTRAVETMHALKSASYSVHAPVVMGAQLAGAGEGLEAALAEFAAPLGVAFQLRDDILGMFGSTTATGKPIGSDLREGKRTSLVIEALRDEGAARRLQRVLGRPGADDAEVLDAVAAVDGCGARERIERRIVELAQRSHAALDAAALPIAGRVLLSHAIDALTTRGS